MVGCVGKMHPIETITIEKPQLGGDNISGLLVEFLTFLPFAVQGVTQLRKLLKTHEKKNGFMVATPSMHL